MSFRYFLCLSVIVYIRNWRTALLGEVRRWSLAQENLIGALKWPELFPASSLCRFSKSNRKTGKMILSNCSEIRNWKIRPKRIRLWRELRTTRPWLFRGTLGWRILPRSRHRWRHWSDARKHGCRRTKCNRKSDKRFRK